MTLFPYTTLFRSGIRAEVNYFERQLAFLEEDIENLQNPSKQSLEESQHRLSALCADRKAGKIVSG
jgi:hypothetical protein